MARALFLSLPLTGHVHPSLGLVRELVSRGDEVIYYSADAFASKVADTQAVYRPYRNAYLSDLRGFAAHLHDLAWLLTRTTSEILEAELDDFRALRPDYVIADSVAPWGTWVAQILGIPLITSVSTFAFNRKVFVYALKHGVTPNRQKRAWAKMRSLGRALLTSQQLRRRYRVRGFRIRDLVMASSHLNIVYTSRAFQPCAESFDDRRFLFVGPSIGERGEAEEFPWEQMRHRTILYISLGTLFHGNPAFYRACFEAFAGEECQVILALGSEAGNPDLGEAPANFIVRRYVPQLAVLACATVFVTHAGMNSVNESLACGVPMVVVPQMSEQEIVGRRVEELGAGIYLANEDATADRLRAAVQRVIGMPQFRARAVALQESFRGAGGVGMAVSAIRAFTGRA